MWWWPEPFAQEPVSAAPGNQTYGADTVHDMFESTNSHMEFACTHQQKFLQQKFLGKLQPSIETEY